jgi:hypothetical protein
MRVRLCIKDITYLVRNGCWGVEKPGWQGCVGCFKLVGALKKKSSKSRARLVPDINDPGNVVGLTVHCIDSRIRSHLGPRGPRDLGIDACFLHFQDHAVHSKGIMIIIVQLMGSIFQYLCYNILSVAKNICVIPITFLDLVKLSKMAIMTLMNVHNQSPRKPEFSKP